MKPPFTFFQEYIEILPGYAVELASLPLGLVPEVFDVGGVLRLLHKSLGMINPIMLEL